jgi:hypothetical protein
VFLDRLTVRRNRTATEAACIARRSSLFECLDVIYRGHPAIPDEVRGCLSGSQEASIAAHRDLGYVIPAEAGIQCEMSVAITLAACVRHSRGGGNPVRNVCRDYACRLRTSYPRRRESSAAIWIPACAGMTVSPNFKSVNPNFRTVNPNFRL